MRAAARSWEGPPEDAGPVPGGSGADDTPLIATDFRAAQRANRRKTDLLLAVLLLLGGAVGYAAGWVAETLIAEYETILGFVEGGAGPSFEDMTVAEALAALTTLSPYGVAAGGALLSFGCLVAAYTFAGGGGRMVAGLAGARMVSEEEETVLHHVVEEVAIAAGLPKPDVTVIPSAALNAFAAGMTPETSTIGVTGGLLRSLDRDELQGVVAHEMAHILNGDTRYMTALSTLAGLVALVSDGVLNGLRVGGQGLARLRVASVLVMAVAAVFMVLAPIAAKIIQFAVSREREYLADATAVALTRDARGLIGALEKLHYDAVPFPGANRATQHMLIVNPFRDFDEEGESLFSTHPALSDRIKRLRNLGQA